MIELEGNDPRVKAAAQQLEITIVLRAWEDDGTIFIQDPWSTYEIPCPGGLDDTSPRPAAGRQELDDFTAISGVGSVTAQRLHDLGLYTYDDLREWLVVAEEVEGIGEHTLGQIEAWLAERLV